jgi:hypothetical protein
MNNETTQLTHRQLTSPFTATGRSKIPCMPKIADWGGLMIGVPMSDPNTPPLLIVKVPPSMSSIASSPFLAYIRQIIWKIATSDQLKILHFIIK